ncbi:hypothetical protein H0H92_014031 [Tricholoma furcatifolium]|nr:hypothetical protein H0H92_014031 [Tricholoma furcatifolium]
MQRTDLVLNAWRGFSSYINANNILPSQRSTEPPLSFAELRPHARTCEEWEREVVDLYMKSQPDGYGSARQRILSEKVVEMRTYKQQSSDYIYTYLVVAISTMNLSKPPVLLRLRMELPGRPVAMMQRIDSWPKSNLLAEQLCFTSPRPVLLDLVLLAPIVSSMSDEYLMKGHDFFFADLIFRAFQELFTVDQRTGKVEKRYTEPTFVLLDRNADAKQPERCFVVRFRSKMLDEIEPQFIKRRREFGLRDTPRSARVKVSGASSKVEIRRPERSITIVDGLDADQHLSEKARGKRRATE